MIIEVVYKGKLPREYIPVKHVEYDEKTQIAVISFEKDAIIRALGVTLDGGTGYYYIEARNVVRWDLPNKPTFLKGIVKDGDGEIAGFILYF
ncbi:MAG: hypothetical protein Q8Q46_01625 [Candidatus Giovannonibacteria bacterium]|nr:hypothetical protein [Candidatus Giovannonibacteria bacterium]